MKSIHTLIIAALALPLAAIGEDKEEKTTFDKLPKKVAEVIKKAAGEAKIKEVSREEEDGKTAYEAGWDVKGRLHEITVAEDGTILAEEQAIELSEAPEAVRAAIEKVADGKKVTKVEKVTEKGATLYEAVIETAKGKLEVEFDAKGKELKREEGAEKD